MWRELRRCGYFVLGCALAAGCGESTRSSATLVSTSGGAQGTAGMAGVPGLTLAGTGGAAPVNPYPCRLDQAPPAPVQRLSITDIDGALTTLFGKGDSLADRIGWREVSYSRVISRPFVRALRDVAAVRAAAAVGDDEAFEICDGAPAKHGTCAEDWLSDWGSRIYRRPLTDEQLQGYVKQFASALRDGSGPSAARNALVSMLMSPYFALRIELAQGPSSDFLTLDELAARISHFAARTTPDDELRSSVKSGALAKPEEALAQFQRLSATPEGKQARATFVLEWFGIDRPPLTDALPADTQLEMIQRARQLAFDSLETKPTLDALLTSARDSKLEPELAAGMLATEAFLVRYPRPSARGIAIQVDLLGGMVPSSPAGVDMTFGSGNTPRQRIESVGSAPQCFSCHRIFDPIGFALDAFDDQGRPTGFDSSGFVPLATGAVEVKNPAELGRALANSDQGRLMVPRRLLELALDRWLNDDPRTATITSGAPPPVPIIRPDPDGTWLNCLQQYIPPGQPLDLTEVATNIVRSEGFRRRAQPPRAVAAFDVSVDPSEHALQETTTLVSAFMSIGDYMVLSQYRDALLELIRQDAQPGGAGGAGAGGAETAGAPSDAGTGGSP